MKAIIVSNTIGAIRKAKLPNKFLYFTPSKYYHSNFQYLARNNKINIQPNSYCGKYYTTRVENSLFVNNGTTSVLSSPRVVALEYADLNLPPLCEDVGHVRIRQHVNPLTAAYCVPAEAPDWNVVYKNSSLPLMVDVGCGSGRFLLWLAKKNIDFQNYLGLEIRGKLVQRANVWIKDVGISNAHFISANATVSFDQLVSSYPGPLRYVSILCPDPHFKNRHRKRRVLQKPLVDSIVSNLTSGGQVFVQSDVVEVAVDMRNQFDNVPDMQHIDSINPSFICDDDGWLLRNPMGIRTEREIHAELEGAKIYRRMYQKGE